MYTLVFLFTQFVAVYSGYVMDRNILMFTFGMLVVLDIQLICKILQFNQVGVKYQHKSTKPMV